MPSFSLAGLRKDACNGHSVMALSVDGAQVFCFIGWMQHTQPDMLSMNSCGSNEAMNVARVLAGFKADGRYSQARDIEVRGAQLFARQQMVAFGMMPMHLSAEAKAYAIELQGYAAHHAMQAQYFVTAAIEQDRFYSAVADKYRERALQRQGMAEREFLRIANVRGLFDTPCMSDAHAIEAPTPDATTIAATLYREQAIAAYGRYASYCARADVAPVAFAEWFADLYMGNETNPACNWN